MPFDNPPVKPEVLSVDGLIAWLQTQPRDRTYKFFSNTCLIYSYLEAAGFPRGRHYLRFGHGRFWARSRQRSRIAGEKPYTFGAALDRARVEKARLAVAALERTLQEKEKVRQAQ